jgi:hypothetical protein
MRPSRRVLIDIVVTCVVATALAFVVLRLLLGNMCCQ